MPWPSDVTIKFCEAQTSDGYIGSGTSVGAELPNIKARPTLRSTALYIMTKGTHQYRIDIFSSTVENGPYMSFVIVPCRL